MARNTVQASDAMHLSAGVLTSWAWGTLAVCVYQVGLPHPAGLGMIVIGGHAAESAEMDQNVQDTGKLEYWNSTAFASCTSNTAVTVAGTWNLVACTKATGTATPRFHTYRWDTATWVHEDAGASSGDSSATGLTEHTLGGWDTTSVGPYDYAASAVWNQRVLTDSEIERLPRGLWPMLGPTVCWEFPSGTDFPNEVNVDHSRFRSSRQTSVGASVTRSARRDPPGFRFSATTRRR